MLAVGTGSFGNVPLWEGGGGSAAHCQVLVTLGCGRGCGQQLRKTVVGNMALCWGATPRALSGWVLSGQMGERQAPLRGVPGYGGAWALCVVSRSVCSQVLGKPWLRMGSAVQKAQGAWPNWHLPAQLAGSPEPALARERPSERLGLPARALTAVARCPAGRRAPPASQVVDHAADPLAAAPAPATPGSRPHSSGPAAQRAAHAHPRPQT